MGSRAQVSAEFFILLGIIFLTAIAFELVSLDHLKDFRIQKESDSVKDMAIKLQKEILVASTVEDGYVRIFTLPAQLESINYSVAIENSTLVVTSKNAFYTVSIPIVVGNLTQGTNNITKTGGVIHIN